MLLTLAPVLYYLPPCRNRFYFAIVYKFVITKILLQRWKTDVRLSATSSPNIITVSVVLCSYEIIRDVLIL